ncbi:MAG: bifunctional metallophosphatase/5'-nucleotidase, partial [Prevotella sp.]|nr:bifunctional metallophosphatase/5'-nucleotidase [Prevotella sp.]
CSNYDFTGTVLEGKIKTHVVLMRKGLRIGVFALDPEMDGLVSKANCQGVTFLDPVAKAQEYADILRYKEKCDLVVLISHLGWDEGTLSDQYVIANTRGIDLVLGGHSHTYFETLRYVRNLDGQEVPVDQNGKHAAFVGKMTLKFDNTRTGR